MIERSSVVMMPAPTGLHVPYELIDFGYLQKQQRPPPPELVGEGSAITLGC